MKKVVIVLLAIFLVGCSSGTASSQDSENTDETLPIEELEVIDTTMMEELLQAGYTVDHAGEIQKILNTIGIDTIEIEKATGLAEDGLNAVVCYPNGYTDTDRRFYFTTENGILFYAGFSNEDLYDSDKGGYLKSYGDVYVPETSVTVEIYDELRALSEEAVKGYLNRPETANFSAFEWGIGRSDEKYKIIGSVTTKNALGEKEDIPFGVWFIDTGESWTVEGITMNGFRVK